MKFIKWIKNRNWSKIRLMIFLLIAMIIGCAGAEEDYWEWTTVVIWGLGMIMITCASLVYEAFDVLKKFYE